MTSMTRKQTRTPQHGHLKPAWHGDKPVESWAATTTLHPRQGEDMPRERIQQLQKELQGLWRPQDRLLFYVQTRLAELAQLGAAPPVVRVVDRPQPVQCPDDTLVPCAWHAAVEGEPA